jgi:hypothetical protein
VTGATIAAWCVPAAARSPPARWAEAGSDPAPPADFIRLCRAAATVRRDRWGSCCTAGAGASRLSSEFIGGGGGVMLFPVRFMEGDLCVCVWPSLSHRSHVAVWSRQVLAEARHRAAKRRSTNPLRKCWLMRNRRSSTPRQCTRRGPRPHPVKTRHSTFNSKAKTARAASRSTGSKSRSSRPGPRFT